jgi:capsular polysaccharide biosynthesis protein
MKPQLKISSKIVPSEPDSVRKHYEGIAYETLKTIWRRRLMILAILLAAFLLASTALVLVGPRYTAEALIDLNFNSLEPTARGTSQPAVAIDPVALVDGAARVIRSPTNAGAVVARLGLDKDPRFARESILWRALSEARILVGLAGVTPSPRDLATKTLMGMVAVNHEPRSYLISIEVTTNDPARAATLANTVALEYLRGQMLGQLTEQEATAAREFAQLSSVYGARHPSYVSALAKLEEIRTRRNQVLGSGSADDVGKFAKGQSFIAAQEIMVPSGPNIAIVLGVTMAVAFAVGAWLALLLKSDRSAGVRGAGNSNERSLKTVRDR